MTTFEETRSRDLRHPTRPIASRLFRRLLLARLARLTGGRIVIRDGDQRFEVGRDASDGLRAEIEVLDPAFYRDVVRGGSIGAGESYMAGRWKVDDLTTLIRILARDRPAGTDLEAGATRVRLLFDRARHLLRKNSLAGSRRNVASHYDLSNEFFATFLDPTLSYSCVVFPEPSSSLEQAARHKNDLICRKLELGPDDEVLEIGTGWGGFAMHAATHYGCRVVSTTLSRRQRALALERVREAGVDDRVEILLEDYRRLPRRLGRRFDKLVSVEMIEAVGHRYLGEYFRTCASLLRDDGRMLLQAITIADQHYDAYRNGVDFIQRYIFPGGCLPSLTSLCDAMTRSSDLRVGHLHDITAHYATTLDRWRRNFRAATATIARLGFDDRFRRMWEFYFAYCEAGFLERTIGNVQLLLTRPAATLPALVPQS